MKHLDEALKPYRNKTEYRHIGKSVRRQDGEAIVTGKALYCDDIYIPNALYMKVLRSPHPHAEVVSIDTSEALALPGVEAIMTHENSPQWKTGQPAHRLPIDRIVRYVGDAVAAVMATSKQIAEDALELIKVEYKLLPAVYDVEDAIKPDAYQIYGEEYNIEWLGYRYENNKLPPGSYFEHPEDPPFYFIREGDPEKGFEECDAVVEGKVSYDKATFPGAPETPFIAARWEDEDHVTVWASSQSPNMMSRPLGAAINAHVFANVPNVGGSYGNKNGMGYISLFVAAAAKVAGKPVRYAMSKEEQMLVYERRLGNKFIGKIGVKKDGMIHAIKGDWLVDTGMSAELTQGQVAEGLGELHIAFNKTPHWDVNGRVVVTNLYPVGICKGFGGQEFKSCAMHLATRALKKLDIDPFESFRKNFCSPGREYYWRTGRKYKNDIIDYDNAFVGAAEKFRWHERWKGWTTPSRVEGNKSYGVGFGVHCSGDPSCDETFAYVRLENDEVIVHCPTSESGMGQRLAAAKTVAEILNVPMERVSLTPSNNINNPADFGLAGSRGTITVNAACGRAAADAKRKLFELFAPYFDCEPEDLDTKDLMVFKKDNPEGAVHWNTLIHFYYSITGEGRMDGKFNTYSMVLLFVEVEIDLDTGLVKLTDVLSGTDVGQVMSPVELKMQLEGGLGAAGIDTGHLEGYVVDPHLGRTLTGNLIDYKWRTFTELPNFDTYILSSKWPTENPFGAIGIGEITGAAGPAAVAMAIESALGGYEFNEYPITPDKVLKALGKA
ncbi:MAG: xanthine dehydrogenase family protein molybdopterin-binding subunit [Clostridiaceae bacterium]|nr:xanthine dehydrogenase family protein molybdopterin-binding subunit [Clostridiaceae bacterium]